MSFIYGHDENAMPGAGKAVSSNAYATGSDQNCGNVITDRPTTRLHAPPGGHSSFSFGQGDDAPVEPRGAGLSRQAAQDAASGARSNVNSQVFGAPSAAYSGSSNAFANGADQNCGNFITDRPTTRLHAPPGGRSQISFGGDDAPARHHHRPDTAAAAAKEREHAGNDIFGAGPAPAPARRAEPEVLVVEPPAAAFVEATEREIRPMLIAELRQLCREHGLSPAGAKETLVGRLVEAIAQGRARVMVPNRGASGVSNVGNNYGRAEGQNVGNFMTGRNSSRVLAPPGGGSSFSLGGYGSEQPPTHTSVISEAKAREISGHDVFDDGPAARAPQMSELKASHLQGHDVFDDAPDRAYVPGRELSDAKFERDFKGHDVFSDSATPRRPGTALSGAKAAEIRGQDIFSDGPGYVAAEMSDARAAAVAAMHGQDVFADGTVERRTTVAVTNPNRNSSNVTF